MVHAARFAPDGKTIIYSAAWEGKSLQLVHARGRKALESHELEPAGADVLAVSSTGEMALSSGKPSDRRFLYSGTLARVPLVGGAPREVLENVEWADWSPDGSTLAMVRQEPGEHRLEFPLGKVLYKPMDGLVIFAFAPKADMIAFIDHPQLGMTVARSPWLIWQAKRRLFRRVGTAFKVLAWSPGGDEIWFTATRTGGDRSLYAVNLSGSVRLLARVPGELTSARCWPGWECSADPRQ